VTVNNAFETFLLARSNEGGILPWLPAVNNGSNPWGPELTYDSGRGRFAWVPYKWVHDTA